MGNGVLAEPVDVSADALNALAGAVAEAKRGDPFAPVTVVAPSPYAAVDLRRRLAAHHGAVNVHISAAGHLAQHLAATGLAGTRRRLTQITATEIVRQLIHPAGSGSVATAHHLASRFVRYRNEGRVPPTSVELFQEFCQQTAEYIDDTAVWSAAAGRDMALVLYLPSRGLAPMQPVLEACATHDRLWIVEIAVEGVDPVPELEFVPTAANVAVTTTPSKGPDGLIVAPDADVEVREALRGALRAIDGGMPAHRIGLLYSTPEPYRRTIAERASQLGLPWCGPAPDSLLQTSTGRRLHAALESLDPEKKDAWCAHASLVMTTLLQDEAIDGTSGEALDKVTAVIDDIAGLDEIAGRVSGATFRATVIEHVGARRAPARRFGRGVLVAPFEAAQGCSLDLAICVGLTEQAFAAPVDGEPSGLEPALGIVTAMSRSSYWSTPRGDLRTGRTSHPPPVMLEVASLRAGRTVRASEMLGELAAEWLIPVPSLEASLAHADATSVSDYVCREFLTSQPRTSSAHPVLKSSVALARTFEVLAQRGSDSLGRFDSGVGPRADLAQLLEQPMYATALQRWARCPAQFFLGQVLGISGERPSDDLGIAPSDRGILVHRVLDRFFREVGARSPDEEWNDADRSRMLQLLDEMVSRDLRGPSLSWRVEHRRLEQRLLAALDVDQQVRHERRLVPVASEMRFDSENGGEVRVQLGSGRSLRIHGRIDRVDRTESGDAVRVVDYKSGSWESYSGLKKDPLLGGEALQLAIYSLAARARFGDMPITAEYWFVTDPSCASREITLDDSVEHRLNEVVGAIASGIERGAFPTRPGTETPFGYTHCRYCEFDKLCPASRGAIWDTKAAEALEDVESILAGQE